MSDTGLYFAVHQHARERAELLDRVLVRLNAGASLPLDKDRQRLAEWLRLLDPRAEDYGVLLCQSLLGGHGAASHGNWGELGDALLQHPVTPAAIARLEQLARALEQGQELALSRLRGGS